MNIGICTGLIAPYYNLVFVIIIFILFAKLFSIKNPKVPTSSWKLLLAGLIIFFIESILTVLSALELVSFPHIIFPLFETVTISLFIYMVLLQREKLK